MTTATTGYGSAPDIAVVSSAGAPSSGAASPHHGGHGGG
jgi:hypothetical protein